MKVRQQHLGSCNPHGHSLDWAVFSCCGCYRLHVACACCRLKLTQKLKQQMGKAEGSTSLDLAKAAKLLTDVAVVGSEADLSGIDVLEADEGFLRDAGQQVRTQAQV